jgi:hypothetical protein
MSNNSKRPDTARIYRVTQGQSADRLALSLALTTDGLTYPCWYEIGAEEEVSGGLGNVTLMSATVKIEHTSPIALSPGDLLVDQDGRGWRVQAAGKVYQTAKSNYSLEAACQSVALLPLGVD